MSRKRPKRPWDRDFLYMNALTGGDPSRVKLVRGEWAVRLREGWTFLADVRLSPPQRRPLPDYDAIERRLWLAARDAGLQPRRLQLLSLSQSQPLSRARDKRIHSSNYPSPPHTPTGQGKGQEHVQEVFPGIGPGNKTRHNQ